MDVVRAHPPQTVSQPSWLDWNSLPWLSRGAPNGMEAQLALRLLESALEAENAAAYLRQELPEIASDFSAQWTAVLQRGTDWERIGEFGRQPVDVLPMRFLTDALDRDAAGCVSLEPTTAPSSAWVVCAAPLLKGASGGSLLVLYGRGLSAKSLPSLISVARALGWGLEAVRRHDVATQRVERLRATLRIASQLSTARETRPLLELIAREAARLLEADRSSIFIWDRENREVVACPALGVEGNMLRMSDEGGIVGQCLRTGQSIRVDEAYADARFNRQIDERTGYRTHTLLCVPLVDATGQRIGAFEVINKKRGSFTGDDEEDLRELGVQAAGALANTREREVLVRRHKQLTQQLTQGVQIIGDSPAISALRTSIERLAATDLPVLILGESGTGKEVVAQSLHFRGPRSESPFVAVNCAAMTETLLESELFGHEKGAFTDAHEARQGKFELAEGGTLFLDEIGDMSPGGQAKLLRVLEQKVITRVGGSQPIRINVRVVAATNVNLVAAVRERKFREDLYYRLSVVTLDLPPLRDRPEDVLALAEYFLARFCVQASRKVLGISAEARKKLQAHSWPGNIRELRNLMERVAFLCPNDHVGVDDLPFIVSPDDKPDAASTDLGLTDATLRFQQEYIRRIIRRVRGNISEAARLLGLHRSNLYRKMRQLGMTEAGEEENDI